MLCNTWFSSYYRWKYNFFFYSRSYTHTPHRRLGVKSTQHTRTRMRLTRITNLMTRRAYTRRITDSNNNNGTPSTLKWIRVIKCIGIIFIIHISVHIRASRFLAPITFPVFCAAAARRVYVKFFFLVFSNAFMIRKSNIFSSDFVIITIQDCYLFCSWYFFFSPRFCVWRSRSIAHVPARERYVRTRGAQPD